MTYIRPITARFNELKKMKESALIIYLTAGYPSLKQSMDCVLTVANSGADLIEIGVPFSDPVADGPIIQYSSQAALSNGITLHDIINSVREIKVSTPLVMMSYLNPIIAYGKEKFFKTVQNTGISGLIIPDIPIEESSEWVSLSKRYSIDVIFLIAPTTSDERIRVIVQESSGFIYCVTVTGTTGVREKLPPDLLKFVRSVRQLTDKPIAVGFGVSTAEQIQLLNKDVDGVIIGSRVIEAVRKREDLAGLIEEFKRATRR